MRDHAAGKHPDLVSYGELSEAEKRCGRAAAIETLRAIGALGCRIERR